MTEKEKPPPTIPPPPSPWCFVFCFCLCFFVFFWRLSRSSRAAKFRSDIDRKRKNNHFPPFPRRGVARRLSGSSRLAKFWSDIDRGKAPPPPWPIAEARHSPTDFACHAIAPATSVFPSGRRDGQSTNTGPAPGPHRVSRRPRPPPQSNRRAKMSHPPGRGSRLTARRQPCSSGTWCSGITPA